MERSKTEGPKPDETYNHPDPLTDAALEWFVRLRGMPEDEGLKADLKAWLDADPRHAAAFVKYETLWALPELDVASKRLAQRLDAPVAGQTHQHTPKRPANRWLTPLAAAAAMMLVAIGVWQYPSMMLHWKADYMTATGEQNTVTLPDGSRMTLNTASAVTLDFQGGRRAVTLLEGEAFFDVVHDPSHPFTVAGSFGEVEVKGTAFSVRTDDAEDTVVLERGRIEVSRLTDRHDQAMLEPGEMVTVTSNAVSPVEKADPASVLAWRDGWIIFRDKPFAAVLNELRRYYGGPVVTVDSRIGSVVVSGNYRLAHPADVIRSLAEAAGATVTRLPSGILILR